MSDLDPTPLNPGDNAERAGFTGQPSPRHTLKTASTHDDRILQLEMENSRLHRLVAELLIKNQKLRKPD